MLNDNSISATYTDAWAQMDNPMMAASVDVVPLDAVMSDNDSKTFLVLRLQGSTETTNEERQNIVSKTKLEFSKRRKKNENDFAWHPSRTSPRRHGIDAIY